MTSTISAVRPLVAIDSKQREVRDADGNRVLTTKKTKSSADDDEAPRTVNYRQRWRVTGEKYDHSVLIPVAEAKLAVTVHEELERARREGTPTGPDGWPIGSVRPSKSPSRAPVISSGSDLTEVRRAAGLGPDAALSFLEFFEKFIVPMLRASSQGNNVNNFRSIANFIDRHLRRHPDGRPLAMWEITSADLIEVNKVRVGSGRGGAPASESTTKKFNLLMARTFSFAAESHPRSVVSDPWQSIKKTVSGPGRRLRKANRMDPDVEIETLTAQSATYRDARRNTDMRELLDDLWGALPAGPVRDALFARLGSGLRPCEIMALEPSDTDLENLLLRPHLSLTLQCARENGGIRLYKRDELKEKRPERLVPIIPDPRIIQSFENALATAKERAAVRTHMLLSGRRRARSNNAHPEKWLASELRFASREKLFTTVEGAPLDATNLDSLWLKTLEKLYPEGDPRRELRMYDFRSLYENYLIDLGVTPAIAAEITGHTERVQRKYYREQTIRAVQDAQAKIREAMPEQIAELEVTDAGNPGDSTPAALSTATDMLVGGTELSDDTEDSASVVDFETYRRKRAAG